MNNKKVRDIARLEEVLSSCGNLLRCGGMGGDSDRKETGKQWKNYRCNVSGYRRKIFIHAMLEE